MTGMANLKPIEQRMHDWRLSGTRCAANDGTRGVGKSGSGPPLLFPYLQARPYTRPEPLSDRQLSEAFRQTACSMCERMVSIAFQIPLDQIRSRTRLKAEAAFARQVAMYLAHIIFSIQLTDAGSYFKRDRTTVAHACSVVEDRRDDPVFDLTICQLEAMLEEARYGMQVFAARRELPPEGLAGELGLGEPSTKPEGGE